MLNTVYKVVVHSSRFVCWFLLWILLIIVQCNTTIGGGRCERLRVSCSPVMNLLLCFRGIFQVKAMKISILGGGYFMSGTYAAGCTSLKDVRLSFLAMNFFRWRTVAWAEQRIHLRLSPRSLLLLHSRQILTWEKKRAKPLENHIDKK